MKKIFKTLLITSLICSLLLWGCTRSSEVKTGVSTESEPESIEDKHTDDGRTVVGISMPDKLLERWNRDGNYLKDEFEKNDCEVLLKYADNLIDTQINDIREMISSGADLLVITAVDGSALSKVLSEAKRANVRVIAYDRLLMDSDAVDYYVSFDNYRVGVLQAEYIVDALDLSNSTKSKNIEFVSGDPVDNNSRYFYQGAIDTLAPYIDSGKLMVPSTQTGFYETSTAQWSTEIAQQRLQIILGSYYPEGTVLDAVLCANDSTALGATNALKADYHEDNKIIVTGQDGDIANIYNILNGTQSMTVYKALKQESMVTADLCISLLQGNDLEEKLIENSDWDFDCVYNVKDYDNRKKIVPSYLLQPITVTAENLKKELFDTGYYRGNPSGIIYAGK